MPEIQKDPNLLTVRQAAESLGISGGTVRLQIRLGALHGIKPGRDYLIHRDEIERYRGASLRSAKTVTA